MTTTKLILLSVLSAFLLCCNGKLQRKEHSKDSSLGINTGVDITRNDIDRYKQKVDSTLPQMDSISRDIYKSAEGGITTLYFSGSDTIKKNIIHYGETGKLIVQVYLRKGNPLLVINSEISYQEPINTSQEVQIARKSENYYYLNGEEKLIHWTRNASVMPSEKYDSQKEKIVMN